MNTNDHHAGYYYNLTGHVPDLTFRTLGNNRTPFPDDWPFMGSVVASRRPSGGELPNAVTLPHKPSKAPYTRPGQFAANARCFGFRVCAVPAIDHQYFQHRPGADAAE